MQLGFVKTGNFIQENLPLLSSEDVSKLCELVVEDHKVLILQNNSKSEASTAKNSPEHQNLKSPLEAFGDTTPIGGNELAFCVVDHVILRLKGAYMSCGMLESGCSENGWHFVFKPTWKIRR